MKVKFGDVVKDVKENVDRANNPYEFYVAGDHMDSEDFRIHRRGRFETDDVGPAFVRIFRPGQVLYGSRRTYLKKVCVADFEGVCANTTFVLETKDEGVLLQKLLPFLMLSEGFTDWSVKHSKGSTNPYVLFSDLADYEFDLPSIDRQRELAELLWAANDLKEKYKKLITASDEMLKAKFREIFGNDLSIDDNASVKLEDLGKWESGGTPSRRHPEYFEGEINWYSAGELNSLYLPPSVEKISQKAVENSAAKVWPAGSMLVGMYDSAALKMGILTEDSASNQACACIQPDSGRVDLIWLRYALEMQKEDILKTVRKGTKQKNLSLGIIKSLRVPNAPLDLQRQFVEIAAQEEKVKANLKKSIADVDNIIKGLING